MTNDEFWRGDPALVKAYRKAEELRRDRINQEQWWQGMYIYEALCDVSPLFRSFGKKGAKAVPYPKKPYDITPTKPDNSNSERKQEKQKMLAAKQKMQAWKAEVHAKRLATKGGAPDHG